MLDKKGFCWRCKDWVELFEPYIRKMRSGTHEIRGKCTICGRSTGTILSKEELYKYRGYIE